MCTFSTSHFTFVNPLVLRQFFVSIFFLKICILVQLGGKRKRLKGICLEMNFTTSFGLRDTWAEHYPLIPWHIMLKWLSTITHNTQSPHTLTTHTHHTHSPHTLTTHTLTTHTHHTYSPHTLTTHTHHLHSSHTFTTHTNPTPPHTRHTRTVAHPRHTPHFHTLATQSHTHHQRIFMDKEFTAAAFVFT